MTSGPVPPADYDGGHLDTDEKLRAKGWAAGLDVWYPVIKTYGGSVGNGAFTNAQLWSLREAVRAEAVTELRGRIEALLSEVGPEGELEDGWSAHAVSRVRELLA